MEISMAMPETANHETAHNQMPYNADLDLGPRQAVFSHHAEEQ